VNQVNIRQRKIPRNTGRLEELANLTINYPLTAKRLKARTIT
jgi:hypothetical protein